MRTEVPDGQAVLLRTHANVNRQPVFTQREGSHVPLTCRTTRLRLRNMLIDAGYLGRHTLYSFRRGTLTGVKRAAGHERAMEVAGHSRQKTMYYYDCQTIMGWEILSYLIGNTETSRNEVDRVFQWT